MQASLPARHDNRGYNCLLVNVQSGTIGVNYIHFNLSWVVFPASVDVQRSESDLRAHLSVATIGGACRHPGQTSHQAHGTSYVTTSVLAACAPYSTFSCL